MNYIYILYEPRSILLLASIIIYAYILNYFMHMQDASMYMHSCMYYEYSRSINTNVLEKTYSTV